MQATLHRRLDFVRHGLFDEAIVDGGDRDPCVEEGLNGASPVACLVAPFPATAMDQEDQGSGCFGFGSPEIKNLTRGILGVA